MKTGFYSYPRSESATKHNGGRACWVVQSRDATRGRVSVRVFDGDDERGAWEYFASLLFEATEYSAWGERDTTFSARRQAWLVEVEP